MPQYWITITSPENFEIDRKTNFPVTGYKERLRKLVGKVQPGDRLVYYLTKLHKFGAICTVTSPSYVDRTTRWSERDELWPCRLDTKPDLVLPKDKMLHVTNLVPSLSFVTEKQRETKWGTAFMGSLKNIPQQDFELIEREMRKRLEERPEIESLHKSLESKLREIGEVLGMHAKTEYHFTPYIYDVVWSDVETHPPTHVFEIQDKGQVDVALAKLQHALTNFPCQNRLFIIVTGERDKNKVNLLLHPYLTGTWGRLGKHTTMLMPEEVGEIHGWLVSHKDILRRFLGE
jgi:predicted RNA-binding protein